VKVLPRLESPKLSVVLYAQGLEGLRRMERLLPWLTPLGTFNYRGRDWIRWSMPRTLAEAYGLNEECECCGAQTLQGEVDDYLIDIAWSDTKGWLRANGYTIHPTEKEGTTS